MDEYDDPMEVTPADRMILRKLGSLCHNRRTTTKELGDAMDASTRRARSWLQRLVAINLVEKNGRTYFPTTDGWEEIERKEW